MTPLVTPVPDVDVRRVAGGVCAVDGITAAGVAAGLKRSGALDVALVDAGRPVPAAAVFTTNQVQAAPVLVSRRHLADGQARAVLLNAGSANACTGPAGVALAEESARAAAAALGCAPNEVLVCSTGVIGAPIPREPFFAAIPVAVRARRSDGHADAAQAILTTDLVAKESAVVATDDEGGACTVGGMAKGSGMIAPSMATLLAVLTTDAPLAGPRLAQALRNAVERTFNRVSVDGCTSTNDTVVLLATGSARRRPSLAAFTAALEAVCAELATALVRDGEGASRVLSTTVRGARTEEDALAVARRVAGDLLVRTALAGGDANWGRVAAAVGAAPVSVQPDRLAITFGDVTVCRRGVVADYDEADATAAVKEHEVALAIDLGQGPAAATVLTCDLTADYVRINADYRS